MRLIDRSFALTRAMELVALIVAMLGIVNTLMVTVIDRRREIGILSAIGAFRGQVVGTFLVEAGLIGFAATISGLAIGGVFSLYIVRELIRLQVGSAAELPLPVERRGAAVRAGAARRVDRRARAGAGGRAARRRRRARIRVTAQLAAALAGRRARRSSASRPRKPNGFTCAAATAARTAGPAVAASTRSASDARATST